ncbi:4-hydroxy-2-oxoheptanedioate aldolase [Loktanella ponticola]|uniref:Hydroxypyruvate/pyruvate aldolase n=1 Tax=Yoonia ponticola TaxID=1524255 RepID=A0A7W9BK91_9RHOB|nr:HpcH/HpaI aldolase/citrate lyase family protein [Yoonia ponticola]MBB5721619.1 4-hydroxy-2-oxoheptanedioate aldolase [Yoonia ponticola]
MNVPENGLKAAMLAGETQYGIWLNTGSHVVAELAGHSGFDWCLIDGEHGPQTLSDMVPQLQALATTPTHAVVRVADAQPWMIKQVLDIGAQTVLVPMVDTGEQATEMGRAMRYPPHGMRGMGASIARASNYGNMPNYVREADAQVCLLVQAESAAALANIDAIAGAEGVDGVFIGPADLSADMGYPGEADHPDVLAAIDHMIDRIHAAGKISGILTFATDRSRYYADRGVGFVGIGADIAIFGRALKATMDALR